MKTATREAAGVWIEFLDDRGHTVARHVIDEWHGRPVPQRGDRLDFADVVGVRKHCGIVIARQFDLQQSVDGEPQVWVRLTVRVDRAEAGIAPPRRSVFSRN